MELAGLPCRLHDLPVAHRRPRGPRRAGRTRCAHPHQCSIPRRQDQPVPGTGVVSGVFRKGVWQWFQLPCYEG